VARSSGTRRHARRPAAVEVLFALVFEVWVASASVVVVVSRAALGRKPGGGRVAPPPPGSVRWNQLAVQVALVGGEPVPWKPNSVLPPAESWPLYETLAKRTVPVLPLVCVFHEFVTAEPLGTGIETDQPAIAEEPAVTRTVVTKPPVQALLETVAVQPPGMGVDEDGGGDGDACDGDGDGDDGDGDGDGDVVVVGVT
jgi:hypothetical protein